MSNTSCPCLIGLAITPGRERCRGCPIRATGPATGAKENGGKTKHIIGTALEDTSGGWTRRTRYERTVPQHLLQGPRRVWPGMPGCRTTATYPGMTMTTHAGSRELTASLRCHFTPCSTLCGTSCLAGCTSSRTWCCRISSRLLRANAS